MLTSSLELNFLRFLTRNIPMSLEDVLFTPLYEDLPRDHFHRFLTGYFADQANDHIVHRGLYLHIPYCVNKCAYCHCQTWPGPDHPLSLNDYVKRLKNEIAWIAPVTGGRGFSHLAFGGGTPSLLSEKQIQGLFAAAEPHLNKNTRPPRISFEGNPGSLTTPKLELLRKLGVQRLSIGVQTLNDRTLNLVGRHQSSEDVTRCINDVKALGFPFLNIDLLAGLPGQTSQEFLDDLARIVSFRPEIIHLNGLSDIAGTALNANRPFNTASFFQRRQKMLLQGKTFLSEHGYKQQGSSAFAIAQDGEDYDRLFYTDRPGAVIGLGAFARSSLPGGGLFESLLSGKSVNAFAYRGQKISRKQSMAKMIVINIINGMDIDRLGTLFNEDARAVFAEEIKALTQRGMVAEKAGCWIYPGEHSFKGLFDLHSHLKILFGKEVLELLWRKYRKAYSASENYLDAPHLAWAIQNQWFTNSYYGLGW